MILSSWALAKRGAPTQVAADTMENWRRVSKAVVMGVIGDEIGDEQAAVQPTTFVNNT
jgi:SH3-like domain-containing protein